MHLEQKGDQDFSELRVVFKLLEVPLVMLLRSGEQDTEREQGEGAALQGPAGQGEAAPLRDFSKVVGGRHELKQASPGYLVSRLPWSPQIPQDVV